MVNLRKFTGNKIGIFGLGKTGIASINAFLTEDVEVMVWDDNKNTILRIQEIFKKKTNIYFSSIIDSFDVKGLNFVIVSPGIPNQYPVSHPIFTICKKYNIPVFIDIDILFKVCQLSKYIGITGTNGKSTTSSLIHHILQFNNYQSSLVGNIGNPALNIIDTCDVIKNCIVELSSYQLDLIKDCKFNIAALLSIAPDHLDRYKSFEDYKNAKIKIFSNQDKDDFAVISLNHEVNKAVFDTLKLSAKQKFILVSSKKILDKGVSVINDMIYDHYFECKNFKLILPSSLRGKHNGENLAISYVVAKLIGLKSKNIIGALHSFVGLYHRMEIFLQIGDITFVNDSKATNISACKESLDCFKNIYLILGGLLKEENVDDLDGHFSEVNHCYLVGRDSHQFIPLLETNKITYTISKTIENSLIIMKNIVKSGTILLSPCCSSFDQWQSFEERGDAFKKLVSDIF